MKFNLPEAVAILQRTPDVLNSMLLGISEEWTSRNEGPDTWSAFDVVGHLIHGEQTDWIPRMEIILSGTGEKKLEPFDRFAQFEQSSGKTLTLLLMEFKVMRNKNIDLLLSKKLTDADLERRGTHPDFGPVTLSQLLATWVVHDLNHIGQICRVMAKQYKTEVGPWTKYLRIVRD